MTQNRQPAGIPVGGQFAAGSQDRAAVTLDGAKHLTHGDNWMFYVTAHDAGRRSILAGPFGSPEEAEAVTNDARKMLSETRFSDTIGHFVEVGITSAAPRPGMPIRTGKFNEQLMRPSVLKPEMTGRDVAVASFGLDKSVIRALDAAWFTPKSGDRDKAVKAAWDAMSGTEREKIWHETTMTSFPVRFAAIGADSRDLIGTGNYTREHYDLLTEPWRKVVCPISASDPDLRDELSYDRHEELTEARAEARAERIYAEQERNR